MGPAGEFTTGIDIKVVGQLLNHNTTRIVRKAENPKFHILTGSVTGAPLGCSLRDSSRHSVAVLTNRGQAADFGVLTLCRPDPKKPLTRAGALVNWNFFGVEDGT